MDDHVDLAGIRTWYRQEGAGDPVVLLHGGLTDSRDFSGNLGSLASQFRVFLPERRGHGHTPDVEGPLSIKVMAEDTTNFLKQVIGSPVHLVGYSAGAMVALATATAQPELIARLVLISGAYHPDGMLIKPSAEGEPPAPLIDAYAEVSPDGREHFRHVIAKVAAAARQPFGITLAGLAALAVPTLVIAADDDLVELRHVIDLYQALPNAELAVIANASHLLLHEHPDQVTEIVSDFLARDSSTRMMPIRRS